MLAGVGRPSRAPDSLQQPARERMIDMLKRHEIQVLRRAGHSHRDVARLADVARRTRRADRLFVRRLKQAGLTHVKDLSSFDWAFNPKIPRVRLVELATARFIRDHHGALLIGPPGVGKSHAAVAIAIGAIRAGYHAFVRSAFDLAQDFSEADAAGQRRDFVQRLTHVDLLVLEDFGMKRLGPTAAEDLLEIFVRRHETASTLITTNRPPQDWGQFLADVPATTAILDRFLAHAEIIAIVGTQPRKG